MRGSTEPVILQFGTDGVAGPLADTSAAGTLGFKTNPADAAYLLGPFSWTKSGAGSSTVYAFAPVFLSSALDLLLGADDGAQVYEEIKWTDGANTGITRVPALISQNVNRGGETSPVVVTSSAPQVLNSITSFTGSTSSDLPYVPTVSLAAGTGVPYFIRLASNGVLIAVYLDVGAADGTDPNGQAAPLDYNASTNNKHWTKAL